MFHMIMCGRRYIFCTLWSVSLDNIQSFEAEVTCLFVKSVRQCCQGLFAFTILLVSPLAFADEPRIFRIGTGEIGGTYYPIGGVIASAHQQSNRSASLR